MDYTTRGFGFRLKKALRYVRLYGVRRTWVKVQGQYHMKRSYDSLPRLPSPPPHGGHVGLIGCGNFAFSNIAYFLRRNFGDVLRGAMDVDIERAASLYERYRLRYYTDDAEQLMADPKIDLVYVASNHASHAEHAIHALRAGKAVHVEKPHCVSEDQLRRLCSAMEETGGKIALGFNRPESEIGREIRRVLDSQPGASMLNWFVAGHAIDPDHWYFHPREGGRVLGNLCHWTDFVYHMVPPEGRFPITITPTRSERADCDIAASFRFGDGSIAVITFSAKGHTFEGVRERFSAHKGNALISMDDFHSLQVQIVDRKTVRRTLFRDHGHERRIRRSYEMSRAGGRGEPLSYVWETGMLFLRTRQALEEDRRVVVDAFPGTTAI